MQPRVVTMLEELTHDLDGAWFKPVKTAVALYNVAIPSSENISKKQKFVKLMALIVESTQTMISSTQIEWRERRGKKARSMEYGTFTPSYMEHQLLNAIVLVEVAPRGLGFQLKIGKPMLI